MHLLIPATNTNKDLCRLLLSAVATRFPTPVFINWDTVVDDDPYKVHMKKVKGTLDYLDGLVNPTNATNSTTAARGARDDLVLIVDGFDIWLQLPPEVFIQRYYEVIDDANHRLEESLGHNGSEIMRQNCLYQSVIFGPDKVCWPGDQSRVACWAAPNSTLDPHAFGKETDSRHFDVNNRPRWLNSGMSPSSRLHILHALKRPLGTIFGPVSDVRDLFQATFDRIVSNYTVDSDQFYFAELWGAQEYSRLKLGNNLPSPMIQQVWVYGKDDDENDLGGFQERRLKEPWIGKDQRTEYHITLDYESKLFQTVAFYDQWIQWDHFGGSASKQLATDILDASPPLGHLHSPRHYGANSSKPSHKILNFAEAHPRPGLNWTDLFLGYNTASQQVWGLIHFTPPKFWRDLWWFRMWFSHFGETIIKNSKPIRHDVPYTTTPDKRKWYPYRPEYIDGPSSLTAGGGVTDYGEWMDWKQLCGAHERGVFVNAPELD